LKRSNSDGDLNTKAPNESAVRNERKQPVSRASVAAAIAAASAGVEALAMQHQNQFRRKILEQQALPRTRIKRRKSNFDKERRLCLRTPIRV